ELRQALFEFSSARTDAACLILKLGLCNRQALQRRGSGSGSIAQLRQMMRADGLVFCRLHLRRSAVADENRRVRQRRLCLGLLRFRLRPTKVQHNRLRLADFRGEIAKARCLTRLTLQALDLAFEFTNDVVETFKVL